MAISLGCDQAETFFRAMQTTGKLTCCWKQTNTSVPPSTEPSGSA